MARINFWTLMVIKDDYILATIELFIRLKSFFDFKTRLYVKKSKKIIDSKKSDGDVYIVLNGPSIEKQNLAKLQGKDIMFVNRGFHHPLYKQIRPKYHVFIDSKMVNGIWDTNWIDEILEMVPDITFVMPGTWAKLDKFQPFIKRNLSIIWLNNKGGLRGIGVAGACFDLSILLGYKRIYFTGFEATGFAQDLLKQASHFYGSIDDKELQNAEDYMRGYYMNCRQIRELILYSKKADKLGLEIINITEGGLLDMFKREEFNKILF